MIFQHYWGSKAIVERIGYKDPHRLGEYKRRHGVPCYLRADPRCSWRRIYYSNEHLILTWELARSRADLNRLVAIHEATEQKRMTGQSGKGK